MLHLVLVAEFSMYGCLYPMRQWCTARLASPSHLSNPRLLRMLVVTADEPVGPRQAQSSTHKEAFEAVATCSLSRGTAFVSSHSVPQWSTPVSFGHSMKPGVVRAD
jgi:hypothetical protein